MPWARHRNYWMEGCGVNLPTGASQNVYEVVQSLSLQSGKKDKTTLACHGRRAVDQVDPNSIIQSNVKFPQCRAVFSGRRHHQRINTVSFSPISSNWHCINVIHGKKRNEHRAASFLPTFTRKARHPSCICDSKLLTKYILHFWWPWNPMVLIKLTWLVLGGDPITRSLYGRTHLEFVKLLN